MSRCISEMVRDRGIVTVVDYHKIVYPLIKPRGHW